MRSCCHLSVINARRMSPLRVMPCRYRSRGPVRVTLCVCVLACVAPPLPSRGKTALAPARARARQRPCPSQFCKSRHGGGLRIVEGTSHTAGDAHRSSTSCRGFSDIINDSSARKTAPDDSSLSCYATLRRHLASRLSAAGARGGHMPTMTGCSFRVSLSKGARA